MWDDLEGESLITETTNYRVRKCLKNNDNESHHSATGRDAQRSSLTGRVRSVGKHATCFQKDSNVFYS